MYSLKYLMCTPLGGNDVEIKKSEFVIKTPFCKKRGKTLKVMSLLIVNIKGIESLSQT